MSPDWKFSETIKKRVRIIRVNAQEHHVDAYDLEFGGHLCLDTNNSLNLGKVKKAKIYLATIRVYHAKFTDEMERQMTESALDNPAYLSAIKDLKTSDSGLTKLELVALKH